MKKQINLTLIYYCREALSSDRLKEYEAFFSQVIVIASDEIGILPLLTESPVIHKKGTSKVAALNDAVNRAKGTHILWLEDTEKRPGIPDLKANTFYTAQLINEQTGHPVSNRQIRLFPNPHDEKKPIPGFAIPDIYSWVKQLHWQKSIHRLLIRGKEFIPPEQIQVEAENANDAPLYLFWKGMQASKNGNFTLANDCFTHVLKMDKLLSSWNKLAAINGLANALMELHRLEKAHKQASRSLQISTRQRTPYLIRYHYFSYKGEHEKAYEALTQYHQNSTRRSDANWDVFLPESQTTFLMAEHAFRLGWHHDAYKHYEQFFKCKNGVVSQAVIEKLLIYAVELRHRKKAIQYFNTLFGNNLSVNFNDEKSILIREALSLFSDNGWYDFVSSVYCQLVTDQPEDENLKYSYIRTLIKNDEIKKAQALL